MLSRMLNAWILFLSPFSFLPFSFLLLLSPFFFLLSSFSFLLSPFSVVLSPFSFPFSLAPFLRHARDSLATIHDVSTVRARLIRSQLSRFEAHSPRADGKTEQRLLRGGGFWAQAQGWRNPPTLRPHRAALRSASECMFSLSTRVTAATAPCCCSCPEPTVARLGAVPLTARGPLPPASRPI